SSGVRAVPRLRRVPCQAEAVSVHLVRVHQAVRYRLFSVVRPPLRPPLFPYTTLFRSQPVASERQAAGIQLHRGGGGRLHLARGLDRKSTRLNSSHGSISYAVFCLKKKIVHKKKQIDADDSLERQTEAFCSLRCKHGAT